MAATLQDLIAMQLTRDAQAYRRADPTPHSFQQAAPSEAQLARASVAASFHDSARDAEIAAAIESVDALIARCDALIARNGRWTRYITE